MPHIALNNQCMLNLSKELKDIYASTFIRNLAFSLVHVFVPIYLYTLGYSINFCIAFMGLFFGSVMFFGPFVTWLSSKYGLKKTFMLSPLFSISYLFLINEIKDIVPNSSILIIAIIGSFAMMLYWIPVNSEFVRHHKKECSGAETGLWEAVANLAAAIGPFLGAIILIRFGFRALFGTAIGLLFLVIIPLLHFDNYKEKLKYKWSEVFSKSNRKMLFQFFAQGFLTLALVAIFPFYIYLKTNDLAVTGFGASLIGIGILLFIVLLGDISDKYGKHKLLRIGSVLHALAWFFVFVVKTPSQIYLASFFLGLSYTLIMVPIFAIFCNHIPNETRASYMAFREIGIGLGRFFCAIVVIMLPLAFKFKATFVICAIASLFFAFNDFYVN